MFDRAPCVLAAMFTLALVFGCGPKLKTYPVTGEVKLIDGTPVTMGMIEFESQEMPVSAKGPIQPDGTFTLGTLTPGDGAVLGKHRAVVAMPVGGGPGGQAPPVIDPKFYSFNKSGLEFTVTDDPAKNHFVVKVELYNARNP